MESSGNELRLVFWETTAGCNLECSHCRRLDLSKELMKSDLTTGEGFKLIDGIRKVGTPILVLSGGEPIFRPDIFDLARHAHEKGLPVALATNGTLVNAEVAKKIVDAKIRRVSISIDGADESTHDDFRKQPGSLKKALEGFKNLKKLGMSMQINCTISKHNVHQIEDLYKLAIDLGSDSLHFFMLVPVGCGVEIAETNMLDGEKYEEVLRWFYKKSKEGKLEMKATCAPHYYRIMRQMAKEEGGRIEIKKHGMGAVTKGCLAGTAVCFVSHKGEVFPCGYLPLFCGNVRKESFKDIWEKSAEFAKLRDPNLLGGKCGICEFKNVCAGCRARAYYQTGDYLDEEPFCIYTPKKYSRHSEGTGF